MGIKRKVTVDGEVFEVELDNDEEGWRVSIDGTEFEIQVEQGRGLAPKRGSKSRSGSIRSGTIASPIPGKVVSIHVSVGDYVEEGSVLMILEAMKMQVAELNCETGDSIEANSPLVIITPEEATSE